MVITLHATVHDGGVALLSNALLGYVDVDPVGEAPHARVNLSKLDGGAGVVANHLLEGRVEIAIVQEDVWVMEPSVEMSLDRLERLKNTLELLVACEDDKSGIGARLVHLECWVLTARDKDLVMFLADFPTSTALAESFENTSVSCCIPD